MEQEKGRFMTKRIVKAKADQEKLKSFVEDTSRVIQDTKLLLQPMDMSVQILNEMKNCFSKWTISSHRSTKR